MYSIGDKIWMTKTFDEIYYIPCHFKPSPLSYPIQKKITQIVYTKEGILYQVKGGHFHESLVGSIVFNSEKEALESIKTQREGVK